MLYPYLDPECQNHAEYHISLYSHKCDSCGKYHHAYYYQIAFFATLDGGDSLDYTECLHCVVKQKACSILRKVKKFFAVRVKAYEIALAAPRSKRIQCYRTVLKYTSK